MATEYPPDVSERVATTLISAYHELYRFTSPICSVVISLVKIGTVIIANPLEKTVESVYTIADFALSDNPQIFFLMLVIQYKPLRN